MTVWIIWNKYFCRNRQLYMNKIAYVLKLELLLFAIRVSFQLIIILFLKCSSSSFSSVCFKGLITSHEYQSAPNCRDAGTTSAQRLFDVLDKWSKYFQGGWMSTCTHCWFNAGPASGTLAQHWTSRVTIKAGARIEFVTQNGYITIDSGVKSVQRFLFFSAFKYSWLMGVPVLRTNPLVPRGSLTCVPVMKTNPLVPRGWLTFVPVMGANPLVPKGWRMCVPMMGANPLVPRGWLMYVPVLRTNPLVPRGWLMCVPCWELTLWCQGTGSCMSPC